MKQLLQNLKSGETFIAEVPIPTPRRGQALVRVVNSLISAGTERALVEFAHKSLAGKARARPDLVRQALQKMQREGLRSTLEAVFNRLDQPMPLGYSSAGVIVALGEGMEGFFIGQRVACAGGNYAVHAEYNLIPRNLLTPIPENVDFESAAFTTLGAIALHGFRLSQAAIGESVAVIGLGLVGLLTAQIAAAAGCRVLGIDRAADRVALAASLGFAAAPRAQAESAAAAFTQGRGFDAVILCADTPSNDPVELAGAIARLRGRVVAVGAVGQSLPRKIYYEKELTFVNSRSYGPGRYDPHYEEEGEDYPYAYVRWTEGRNFEAVLHLMAEGKLRVHPLITHRFPIEQAPEAYELIRGRRAEPFLGVLLTYGAPSLELPAERRIRQIAGPPPLQEVRLGVIGAGNFAQNTLLPLLQRFPSISRLGVASSGGVHAAQTARKFGFAYATSEPQEILQDPQVNVVAILTRHDTHVPLALQALEQGKHVFVEKPLAIDETQLQAIEQALSQANTLLTVGFNRRFAPLSQRLKALLQQHHEPLFAHYRVNAGYLPRDHWLHHPEQGGGRLIGEACHFVDLLTFLVGSVPQLVSVQALPDAGKYRRDNFTLTLRFENGSLAVLDYLANGDRSYPKERLEVFCGGAIAILEDFRRLEWFQDGRRQRFRSPGDKGWYAEWEAFLQALRRGGPPPIPYEHLIGVTRLTIQAARQLEAGA
jgi:predicted dehydrogenase/threonine dehydrogenase-like Zn-dependent dehydrogenase